MQAMRVMRGEGRASKRGVEEAGEESNNITLPLFSWLLSTWVSFFGHGRIQIVGEGSSAVHAYFIGYFLDRFLTCTHNRNIFAACSGNAAGGWILLNARSRS